MDDGTAVLGAETTTTKRSCRARRRAAVRGMNELHTHWSGDGRVTGIAHMQTLHMWRRVVLALRETGRKGSSKVHEYVSKPRLILVLTGGDIVTLACEHFLQEHKRFVVHHETDQRISYF